MIAGAAPPAASIKEASALAASPLGRPSSPGRTQSPGRATASGVGQGSSSDSVRPKRNTVAVSQEIKYVLKEEKAPKRNPFFTDKVTPGSAIKNTDTKAILKDIFQAKMPSGVIAVDDFIEEALTRKSEASDNHIIKPSKLFGPLDMNEDHTALFRNYKKDMGPHMSTESGCTKMNEMCAKFGHQLTEQTIMDHFYLTLPDKCIPDWQRLKITPGMKLGQMYKELCTMWGNTRSQKYLRQELLNICQDMDSDVKTVLNKIHTNLSKTDSANIRERNIRCLEEVQIYLKKRIGTVEAALIFTRFKARNLCNFSDLVDLIEADFPETFTKPKTHREGEFNKDIHRRHRRNRVHEIHGDPEEEGGRPSKGEEAASTDLPQATPSLSEIKDLFSKIGKQILSTNTQVENLTQQTHAVMGACHTCGVTGHFANQCPLKGQDRGAKAAPRELKPKYCDLPCMFSGQNANECFRNYHLMYMGQRQPEAASKAKSDTAIAQAVNTSFKVSTPESSSEVSTSETDSDTSFDVNKLLSKIVNLEKRIDDLSKKYFCKVSHAKSLQRSLQRLRREEMERLNGPKSESNKLIHQEGSIHHGAVNNINNVVIYDAEIPNPKFEKIQKKLLNEFKGDPKVYRQKTCSRPKPKRG